MTEDDLLMSKDDIRRVLEDDAPTRDEFDTLEKRVTKIEHRTASV